MRLTSLVPVFMAAAFLAAVPARAQTTTSGGPTASPAGASVYFINIKDGDTLPRTFTVQFGLRNMGLAPAGSDRPNSGHHHLLIDTDLPAMNEPIPSDFNHLHFGAGQSEATVTLQPGKHTLQLLLGDADHVPHSPPVFSDRITVTVTDGTAPSAAKPEPKAEPKKETSTETKRDSKKEQAERREAERRAEERAEKREAERRAAAERRKAKAAAQAGGAAGAGGGAAIVTGAPARRQEWCQIQALNRTCGFTSRQQCMASVAGVGGSCIER